MSFMDTSQQAKKRIQRREHIAQTLFPLLILTAFLAPFILNQVLLHSTAPLALVIASTYLLPLCFCSLFFLIFILGFLRLGPYMRETQRQKQNWLNEYGRHVLAQLSKHPTKDAFIIGGRAQGKNASYAVYLNWQDPETGEHYAFRASKRFSRLLQSLPEGALCPVQFDASDPAFFTVPDA